MNSGDTFGFLLVFQLSTRCNLECIYCNVDAGPHGFRPVLDPRMMEKWLEAFASLGPSEISIQLHGGEPLIVDPPVELFAAIARNTLARFPRTQLRCLGVQTNGSALNEIRLESLTRAGLHVNVSIDGPASIHDRQRASPGRSNHREAVRAHHLLRSRGQNTANIAVITDPIDVVPAVGFFLEDGFREARMNPMRPEGRGASMAQWDDVSFMHDMAFEYLRAAKLIAAHNARQPEAPFFEFNLEHLMDILMPESREAKMLFWTFMIDDHGHLWAHPSGYGLDALHLTRGGIPDAHSLRQALGLEMAGSLSQAEVATGIRQLLGRLFTACAVCRTPDFCVPVYGRTENGNQANPICVWISELMGHLERWLHEDPEAARHITRTLTATPLGGREVGILG